MTDVNLFNLETIIESLLGLDFVLNVFKQRTCIFL